jgi:hypothetical protein
MTAIARFIAAGAALTLLVGSLLRAAYDSLLHERMRTSSRGHGQQEATLVLEEWSALMLVSSQMSRPNLQAIPDQQFQPNFNKMFTPAIVMQMYLK